MSVFLSSLQCMVCLSFSSHSSAWYVCLSHLIPVHGMSVFLISLQYVFFSAHYNAWCVSFSAHCSTWYVSLSHLIAVCRFFSAHCNAWCVSFSAHSSTLSRKPTIDKEQVEEDLQTVGQISELCSRLAIAHQVFIRQNCHLNSDYPTPAC